MLLYRHFAEILSHQAERQLRLLFPQLQISVGGVRLWPADEIELRAIKLAWPMAGDQRGEVVPLAEVGRVRLQLARPIWECLREDIRLRAVFVEDLQLHAIRDKAGRWNLAQLKPTSRRPVALPRVQIVGGTLHVLDQLHWPESPLAIRVLEATLTPQVSPANSQGASSDGTPGSAALRWDIRAVCEFRELGRGVIEAQVDPNAGNWGLVFQFDQIRLSQSLWTYVPEPVRKQLPELRILGGEVRLAGQMAGSNLGELSSDFTLHGSAEGLRVALGPLTTPLSDLGGSFVITPSQISVNGLKATWAGATINLESLQLRKESATAGVLQGQFAIRNLAVSDELLQLHPQLVRWYETYRPQGTMNLDGTFRFDGQRWDWKVRVLPQRMTVVYSRVPYPVREVSGVLEWTADHLWGNLYGKIGNRPVNIEGRTLWSDGAYRWVVAAPSVAFDREMIAALGRPAGERLAELNPSGDFGFQFVSTRRNRQEAVERQLVVELQDAQVQYQRFPYPLRNVRGILRMWGNPSGELWELSETVAQNGQARVFLRGRLESWEKRHFLQIHFWAREVPIDEELRNAIPSAAAREVWLNLDPRGTLAELSGQVLFDSATGRVNVRFSAEPAPGQCSIQPTWFPYRIDNLSGRLEYRDGHAAISQMRGQHGSARFSATVECRQDPAGNWALEITNLFAEQIPIDQELVQAVPPNLQQILRTLNPVGRVNVRGQMRFSGGVPQDRLIHSSWDLSVDTHHARVDCGLRFTGVSGTIDLTGSSDAERFVCLARLDLTSATAMGVQLTEIRGPVWAGGNQILLGRLVPNQPIGQLGNTQSQAPAEIRPSTAGTGPEVPGPTGPLTARIAGGLLSLDGVINLRGDSPLFRVGFSLHRADLAQLAQEILGRSEDVSGTLYAQGELRGQLGQPESLAGQGVVQLREANVYRTPLMLALLRMLTIREPQRTAFSSADVAFELEGQRILIPYVIFQGDTLGFEGSGELDWQGRVRLVLRANLVRPDSPFPIMRQLVGDASQQLVILHVTGFLHDPVVSSEPLPGVNQMLRELQQEISPEASVRPPRMGPLGRLPSLLPRPR
ncbi:MAG: hypothetical protein NZ899_05900 [Thermoguttaceae bacterium]|nr:hypothetical protein [Thermoguttaceae bacterium]MDW8079474.1 AsmA-like C-terminal region-containing protein [Thermoguttaceae bacterium]